LVLRVFSPFSPPLISEKLGELVRRVRRRKQDLANLAALKAI
jgi:hypothetical protein